MSTFLTDTECRLWRGYARLHRSMVTIAPQVSPEFLDFHSTHRLGAAEISQMRHSALTALISACEQSAIEPM